MALNTTSIYASLFNRVATDAAGADVRALLGVFPSPFTARPIYAGRRAAFDADDIKKFAGKGVTFPWAAFRKGTVSGESGDIRPVFATWWLYIPDVTGWNTQSLTDIADILERIYGYEYAHAIPGGRITASRGQIVPDDALTAYALPVVVSYSQRG
jgi:hypothetical protein